MGRKCVAYVSFTNARAREEQFSMIARYCGEIGIVATMIVDEASAFSPWRKRKVGALCEDLKAGDMLVCDQFSRLGASIADVTDLLAVLGVRGVEVHFARYGVVLDTTLYTRTFLSFLGLFTAIEKEFRGLKIKERKAAARAEGRPRKSRKGESRLNARKAEIRKMLKRGETVKAIAKAMEVHYQTMRAYIKASPDLVTIVPKR